MAGGNNNIHRSLAVIVVPVRDVEPMRSGSDKCCGEHRLLAIYKIPQLRMASGKVMA
jgi:hypothetical protein